jgi:hypothetical protein
MSEPTAPAYDGHDPQECMTCDGWASGCCTCCVAAPS